jgi:hypothetical protein
MIHPGVIEKSAGIAALFVLAIYAAVAIGSVLGLRVWNAVRSQRPIEDVEEFEARVRDRIESGARFRPRLINKPEVGTR